MTAREPRVVLAQRPTRRDHLHGAWWPHSDVLDDELLPMLTLVGARFGPILGVMLNRDEWPGAALAGHRTGIGRTTVSWYGLADAHQAVVLCDHARRLAFLLVPPDTQEPVALTATLMACTSGNALSTEETLNRARAQARSCGDARTA